MLLVQTKGWWWPKLGKKPENRLFHVATDEEIKSGETTDVYFVRTKRVLEWLGLTDVRVVAEITPPRRLPQNWPWCVLCGVEEAAKLLEGYPVTAYSMPEGTVFFSKDSRGYAEPVFFIEGKYVDFGVIETALLGLLCQATGVATRAARIRKIAGDKLVASFGIRRMHPAIAPMIDRAAYIGGFDGVSGITGAKLIGMPPVGTMPHALIIIVGDQVKAWKAFDEALDPEIPRVALVDTYYDEKVEAVMAAEALGERLFAVRLDTPGSRRGDFVEIVKEVKWELDLRGYKHVKIFVSGGLDEETVRRLVEAGADAFGVGTSVSNAPTVDFAMDVVEVEGKPVAKRGKFGGKKQVWRCWSCFADYVAPWREPMDKCPTCGDSLEPLLKPLVENGKIVADLPKAPDIREYVLHQLKKLPPI